MWKEHESIMNRKHILQIALVSLLGAASIHPAFASGTSAGRMPKPSNSKEADKLDREKYGLGQKIYDGKVKVMASGDAAVQMDKLKVLQGRLPAKVAKKKDLVSFAGKLTTEQLEALEYFVQQRFPVK